MGVRQGEILPPTIKQTKIINELEKRQGKNPTSFKQLLKLSYKEAEDYIYRLRHPRKSHPIEERLFPRLIHWTQKININYEITSAQLSLDQGN